MSYFSCLIHMRISIFILIEAHEWQSHVRPQLGRDDPKHICTYCKFQHTHKILLFNLVTDVTYSVSINRNYMNGVCVPTHITDVCAYTIVYYLTYSNYLEMLSTLPLTSFLV